MSWCWTLSHTGMARGIAVSGIDNNQLCVEVGANYVRRAYTDVLLRRQPNKVSFHKHRPPRLEASRLMAARAVHYGGKLVLQEQRQSDKAILVYVDTGHTPACDAGGDWSFNDTALVKELISGEDGHSIYKAPVGGPHTVRVQQVDKSTCYKKGLLLLLPGSRLTVSFNAPGTLTAEVGFDGDWPSFRITASAIDPSYEFQQQLRSSPSYRETGLFHDPFDGQS